MSPFFDEVQVFDSIAERTGLRLDRAGVRGRAGVCRSLTELGAKCRRLGDGYYYIASSAWPPDATALRLGRTWAPLK